MESWAWDDLGEIEDPHNVGKLYTSIKSRSRKWDTSYDQKFQSKFEA